MKKMIANPYLSALSLNAITFIIFHAYTKSNIKTNLLIHPEKPSKIYKILQAQLMSDYSDVLLIIVKSVMELKRLFSQQKQVNASNVQNLITKSQNACQIQSFLRL